MTADFFFDPPTFNIPTLGKLRKKWINIENTNVREVVACEDQFLQFHLFSLEAIKHTGEGSLGKRDDYVLPLGLSVRGGAVKAALLICASITEAVLRYHAEKRGYKLHSNLRKRTFGNVIAAWETNDIPNTDVASIWPDVKSLRDIRNNIHLFKAAGDPTATFENIILEEKNLLNSALAVVTHLAGLASP
jgi:hypothetical protein